MRFGQSKKDSIYTSDDAQSIIFACIAIAALYGIAASLFFPKSSIKHSGNKLDIEIRYDVEKDADSTFLAQNLVKIISIVLSPLESMVAKEQAKLIFVYSENSWEMRVRNGSERLRTAVRKLLESGNW